VDPFILGNAAYSVFSAGKSGTLESLPILIGPLFYDYAHWAGRRRLGHQAWSLEIDVHEPSSHAQPHVSHNSNKKSSKRGWHVKRRFPLFHSA
jgi:hypothetical protein